MADILETYVLGILDGFLCLFSSSLYREQLEAGLQA
jgi:hypothetical protein